MRRVSEVRKREEICVSTNGGLWRGSQEEREKGTWCVSEVRVGERSLYEY